MLIGDFNLTVNNKNLGVFMNTRLLVFNQQMQLVLI